MKVIDANKQATVREIFKELDLEQSLISQHLKILRHAKLVKSTRDGKFVNYTVEYEHLKYTADAISQFMTKAPAVSKA